MGVKKIKPRVLLGKPGLCGHDRGALILAMALRDAGMEVIYSGRHNLPEQLVVRINFLSFGVARGCHLIGAT